MINFLLIFYWIFIIGFVFSALAVMYHLWFYQMNKRMTFFITALFSFGAVILLGINFILASRVPWGNFNLFFNF